MWKIGIISQFLLVLFSSSIFGNFSQPSKPDDIWHTEKITLDQTLDKRRYDNRVKPINKSDIYGGGGPVIVRNNMYLRQIEYIDTKKQEWKVQVTFRQQWNDPRLIFDDKQGRIGYLVLRDIDRLWIPDTYISNSRSTKTHKDLKQNSLVRIYPNGNVLFSILLTITMDCLMDLKNYPFDTQECYIQLASYAYTTDDIVFKWKDGDPVQITRILHIPDFMLESYKTSDCSSQTNTGEYSCLKLGLTFKRDSTKYICEWLIPTAFLTFLSFASFWMKPKKSSRVKFLATILVLLYLHILYINNKSAANFSAALNYWTSTCLAFVLSAFIEYGILTIIGKSNKQNMKELKPNKNGKQEGDGVALKPLVEGMDNNIEEIREHSANETSSHNLMQMWKRAPTSFRIDIISSLIFPLFFILYIIIFTIYQILGQ